MRQSRIREALGRIYDHHPPQLREQIRRLEEDPKSRVFAPLAESYRRLGRVDEAIRICTKGLEHHPDYASGRLALAKCFIDKKKFVEAKRELERVIHQAPENLLAQRLLADMLLSLEDLTGAIHHYKMALLLAPEDVALHEKIRGLEAKKDSEGAWTEKDAQEEIQIKPLAENAVESPVLAKDTFDTDDEAEEEHTKTLSPLTSDSVSTPPPKVESSVGFGEPVESALSPLWIESESPEDENTKTEINRLLGLGENEDEDSPFKSEPFSHAFIDSERERNKEITTSTLADLYLAQGQLTEALEMLERLFKKEPSPELLAKIQDCRRKLGVDQVSLLRQRQIETLRGILRRQGASNK